MKEENNNSSNNSSSGSRSIGDGGETERSAEDEHINMDEREVAGAAAPRFCLGEFETKCSLIPNVPAERRDVYRETLAVG